MRKKFIFLFALAGFSCASANAAIIEHFSGFNRVSSDARYVLKSGDTMAGPLTVSSDVVVTGDTTLGTSGDASNVGIGIAPSNSYNLNV
jgi:hypothetical protein